MAHVIQTTEALVIDSEDTREDSKTIILFTKEFGLIRAHAQGVRKLKAKLKYSLQDFSISRVSLIRGREYFRITSAEKLMETESVVKKRDKREIVARVFDLLKRFIVGEEKDENLFDIVLNGLSFLNEKKLSTSQLRQYEIVMVLKILRHLGYIGSDEELEPVISPMAWSEELLGSVELLRSKAIASINSSLGESGL